jgi:hypothetical protein
VNSKRQVALAWLPKKRTWNSLSQKFESMTTSNEALEAIDKVAFADERSGLSAQKSDSYFFDSSGMSMELLLF